MPYNIKIISPIIFFLLLTACGGGGDSAITPSQPFNADRINKIYPSQATTLMKEYKITTRTFTARNREEFRQELISYAGRKLSDEEFEAILAILNRGPNTDDCMAEGKILDNARNTCRSLIATDCNANNQILINGRCESCTGNTPNRVGNVCEPSQKICNDKNQILVANGRCIPCTSDKIRIGNECRATMASCHANNQIHSNGICYSCPNYQVRIGNECHATMASCNAHNRIFDNNDCRLCPSGQARVGNFCVTASIESCSANNQIFYEYGGYCYTCPSETRHVGNSCHSTIAWCNTQNRILDNIGNCSTCPSGVQVGNVCVAPSISLCNDNNKIFSNNRCESCPSAHVRKGNVCRATIASCNANEKILSGDRCESCPSDQVRVGNTCRVPSLSVCHARNQIFYSGGCFSCYPLREGNDCYSTIASCNAANEILDVDGYCRRCPANQVRIGNTCQDPASLDIDKLREGEINSNWGVRAIHADNAHSRGYEGQNVTLFSGIRPYYVIGHFEVTNALVNPPPQNHYIPEFTGFYNHELAAIGLIIAERNNRGIVGIAPRGRLLSFLNPERSTHFYRELTMFLAQRQPQVISNSYVISFDTKRDFHGLRAVYSDFVWVNSRGNIIPSRSPRTTDAQITLNKQEARNWLSVANIESGLSLSQYSQPCGDEKEYCLVAPGNRVYAPGASTVHSTTDFRLVNGTSFAAPHVAGALMVMRSAAQEIHMTVHRQILLTTATDLGDEGVDAIYGHGLVNLSSAIDMIEARRTPEVGELAALSADDFHHSIPAAFSHLHQQIGKTEIAFRLADDFYYNAPLEKLLAPTQSTHSSLGNIAEEMTNNPLAVHKSGFVANGSLENGFSIRWNGVGEHAAMFAEVMNSPNGMLTGDFGAMGNIESSSRGGKVGIQQDLWNGLRYFGEYGYNDFKSSTHAGSYIAGTENAKGESWMTGLEFVIDENPNRRFRLWAKENNHLSGGDLVLRYPHYSDGEVQVQEKHIPLQQQREIIWSFGYAADLPNKHWATGIAYNNKSNEIKASAKLEFEL